MSGLKALVDALRGLTDQELRSLIAVRLTTTSGIEDFYDLAEQLDSAKSYSHIVGSLSASQLDAIGGLSKNQKVDSAALFSLQKLHLVFQDSEGWKVFPQLLEILSQHRAFTRPIRVIADDQAPRDQVQLDRHAGIVAFESMQALTEVIFELEKHLVREVGKGSVGLPDVKRLAGALGRTNEQAKYFFQVASLVRLTTVQGGRHQLTGMAATWLQLEPVGRYELLVSYFKAFLGADICLELRSLNPGENLATWFESNYPLAQVSENSKLSQITKFAENFGLTSAGFTSSWFSEAIAGEIPSGKLVANLPQLQNRMVLQADGSLISLGPLATKTEILIRRFAQSENVSLASTFRLNALSICHGIETGLSIGEIRDCLSKATDTPLPQPIEYLFREVEKRFGRLKVSTSNRGDLRTNVESQDEVLLTEISNDSRLKALSFDRLAATRLGCRFEPSIVYFALRDAGYLAIQVDAAGNLISPLKSSVLAENESKPSTIDNDILRWRSAHESTTTGSGDEALTRQIQLAIRNKARISVLVKLPSGQEMTFEIEPSSIANGRLRGKDKKAQIERTLPLSTIVSMSLS